MTDLNKKALGRLVFFLVLVGLLVMLPGWTVHYWQGWVFLGVLEVLIVGITAWLMKNDPKLLERRMNAGPAAEKEKVQKVILFFAQIAFVGMIVFPGIDHRFGWSVVPAYACVAGDVVMAVGYLLVWEVFRENSFASSVVEVGSGQTVVSTGLYGLVRHPMYSGALLSLLGVPVGLGSWWGLLAMIPIAGLIVWRLLDEERFLAKNLARYAEYRERVRWRLLPGVW
jgi:protein-S-isoprenylcysteine O-methyltransferase Ste14